MLFCILYQASYVVKAEQNVLLIQTRSFKHFKPQILLIVLSPRIPFQRQNSSVVFFNLSKFSDVWTNSHAAGEFSELKSIYLKFAENERHRSIQKLVTFE